LKSGSDLNFTKGKHGKDPSLEGEEDDFSAFCHV
jgi:hypothetical protein